jgi:hypothetical protein
MKSKTVTARKPHDCDACTRGIKPGEKYILEKYRHPVFDSFDPHTGCTEKQIGIVYCTYKTCIPCFDSQSIECFEHAFVAEIDMDNHGNPTGREFCQNCGMQKPELI